MSGSGEWGEKEEDTHDPTAHGSVTAPANGDEPEGGTGNVG